MRLETKKEQLNYSLKFTPENQAEEFQLKALRQTMENMGMRNYTEERSLIIHLPGEDDAN